MQPSCAFSLICCFHSSSYFILPHFLCQSFSFVTLPLFPARCDQLRDISATDIPGDRTSGVHGLLHLLSFRLPSVSSPHTWLSLHSCSSSQITDLAPLLGLLCKLVLSSLTETMVAYHPSSRSPIIYPPFSSPFMFWLHGDIGTSSFFPILSPLPSLLLLCSTPLLFPLPLLSSILLSPGCLSQWGTCLFSYMPTAHLYPSNHLSFASDVPCRASKQDAGEWRTSTLIYLPPSIHSVIPSHIERRPYFTGSGNYTL